MDGNLTNEKQTNSPQISETSFVALKNYFATGILLSKDLNSLHAEITAAEATLKAALSLAL
jgi:hypothetical protein